MGKQYEYQNDTEENYYSSSSGVTDKLTYLLVGGGIGAVLALLFAPKSGRELRGDIADATRKGYDKTRDAAQQLGQRSGEYYESARQVAGDVYSRAGDAYSAARSRFSKSGQDATDTARQIGEQTGISEQNTEDQATGSNQGDQMQQSNILDIDGGRF